ncbi:protein CASC3-like isoform X2 [Anneissia japonica]|uniref:protein CASC3-like isoform X2 n=1 Tax=Anneissia japonica TaxID=1529436 RepID=UPI001425826A|nr:protein CASC3-like isoform X2 [Anneissia japonica]
MKMAENTGEATHIQESKEAAVMEAEQKEDVSVTDVTDSVNNMKLNETVDDSVPEVPAQEIPDELESTTTAKYEDPGNSKEQPSVDNEQDAALEENSNSLEKTEQNNISEDCEYAGSCVDPVVAPPPQKTGEDDPQGTTDEDDPRETTEEYDSQGKTGKDNPQEMIVEDNFQGTSEEMNSESHKLTAKEVEKAEEMETENSEDEHDDEGSDFENTAPVRRRRGVSSDGEEEEGLEEQVVESDGNISEEEDERDVIIESEGYEDGDIEEPEETIEEEKEKEKEDTENPQFVPKHGMFFMHDNRTDASSEETKDSPAKKKLWDDKGKWSHDRFLLEEQGPKSYRDVINVYGYDIREKDYPPTSSSYTRGRGGRGRGRGGQRSRPLVSDYIQNSAKTVDHTETSRGSTQRRGFGRGLQRGRRRTYPKQSEERMVDEVNESSPDTTQTYRNTYQENHSKDAYTKHESRYSNREDYNRRNRSDNRDLQAKQKIYDNDESQRKSNRGRNSNYQRRGGDEPYETTGRQESRDDDKRDTRYRNERSRDTYEIEPKDYRFRNRNPEHRNRFKDGETFEGSMKDTSEKRNEANRGNIDFRYSRRGGFNEGKQRGTSNESTFTEKKVPIENQGDVRDDKMSRVSATEEEWPTLGRQPSQGSSNTDNVLPSSQPNEWTNKELRTVKKESPTLPSNTKTQHTKNPVENIVTKDRISKTKDSDTSVEESAYSRESKSFSQRRHQRSTIKEIPKIPVTPSKDAHPQVAQEAGSFDHVQPTSPAPKLLQNFQIRVEGGQRKIIDDSNKKSEEHSTSKDEPTDATNISSATGGRGGSRPHRYSSQRQRTLEARAGIPPSSSESPQHYFEPGYQAQVYQSDGTPPPNISDPSLTPTHGMMRQTTKPSGSPSPRLSTQRPPPSMPDSRPPQTQLSDAAALLPNRLPVQGLQHAAATHPRNTGMLHPAVSMGAHPPQGAFPPTTFVNVHYNPGHPVPQPVHTRPTQGHPVPPPVHASPVQGHPGPPHGHPRPAQGLTGPINAPFQIGGPVPVQHFPVNTVPQAGVGATQNLPSMGQQIQPEVILDNLRGLTYKGATYYSPEIQLGMQRAPQRRQPQPVRIEAPPESHYVEQYQGTENS